MHETSIMTNLMRKIETVAKENQSDQVTGVHVRLGALSHFTEEHFQEHFLIASKGSIAEGAKLYIAMDDNINAPTAQDVWLEEIDLAASH